MKWLILFASLFSLLVVFLLKSAPIDYDPLHAPSPGNVALSFVLVGESDPQLTSWESRGGHYFWDMVPWPWNPDAQVTRNGGG